MNTSHTHRIEILAPAGNAESMMAAVRCGADAIYLGGKTMNARQSAANFEDAALHDAVAYCHMRNVKVYMTLNTLVLDDELPALDAAIATACRAGVDALIVQDWATAVRAKACAPTMPLHASTQMSIHNASGARALASLGLQRVVLARELTHREIDEIKRSCSIELECFVHGALCMSVSGQCYLSAIIGGRSGNRGLCAQPCRLPFSSPTNAHALSLRDLSLIPHIRELENKGIASVKIEGRMKRPEYVAAAVTACRLSREGETPDYAALEAVFSRGGFTDGYYTDTRGRAMFGIRRKEDVQSAAPVLKKLANLYKDEAQKIAVQFDLQLCHGQPAQLSVTDQDGHSATVCGAVPEPARTAPTDKQKAWSALSKTGGTIYHAQHLRADLQDGLMVSASQLNALRRDALDALTLMRASPRAHSYHPSSLPASKSYRSPHQKQRLRARFARAGQLTAAIAQQIDEIVLPVQELSRVPASLLQIHKAKVIAEIPAVCFDLDSSFAASLQKIRDAGISAVMVGNLGAIPVAQSLGFQMHGDYGLNITNTIALEAYAQMGITDLTVSFELHQRTLRALGGVSPRGVLAYGHLPVMTTRNCPVGQCRHCKRAFPTITDRKGNRFLVDCTNSVATLYNYLPLVLSDVLEDFSFADFFTLYFTAETAERCMEVIRLYRNHSYDGCDRTKGLYYRGIR